MNPRMCTIIQPSAHCLHITPLGRVSQQSGNAARITRTWERQEGPTAGGLHVSTAHRPPFPNAIHSPTNGVRITLVRRGQEGPAAHGSERHGGRGKPCTRSTARAAPFPLAPDAVSRACTARRQLPPPPLTGGTARHGCSHRASTQGPGRATAHRSSSKMAGGIW